GILVVAGVASNVLGRWPWWGLVMFLYFGPLKATALLGLTGGERRRLTWGRLLAFFLWVGQQPRPFLLSSSPPDAVPRPSWRGCLLNLVSGSVLLWGVPWLFPPGTPLLIRAWTGLIGMGLIRLFAVFDALVLLYNGLGFPVDKIFVNPVAAT